MIFNWPGSMMQRTPLNLSEVRMAARCSERCSSSRPIRNVVLVRLRNHALEVGEFAFHQLRHQFHLAEGELHLGRRNVDLQRVVDVFQQALQFQDRLARNDHFLARRTSLRSSSTRTPDGGRPSQPPSTGRRRPPAACRSGSSGCPAGPSRNGPCRAIGGTSFAEPTRLAPKSLAWRRSGTRRRRASAAQSGSCRIARSGACRSRSSVTWPSGMARRMSSSLRAATVVAT